MCDIQLMVQRIRKNIDFLLNLSGLSHTRIGGEADTKRVYAQLANSMGN